MANPDFDLLAETEDLPLWARGIVEGLLTGLHRSPYHGYGHEFDSYRSYVPGDNVRYVDWKVWSRTDKIYVKEFEDETNFTGHVFLDASASMDLGAGHHHKFRYGHRLAAALAHLMIVQRDTPGLAIWNAAGLTYLPPRRSRQQVEMWAALPQNKPTGKATLPEDLQFLVDGLFRRGVAVVISDFLTEENEAMELCEILTHHRQEVIAFQLLSPEECDLSFEDSIVLVDNETGEERPVDPGAARAEYQAELDAFCAGVEKRLLNAGIEYHRLRTDESAVDALRDYLLKREATSGG